VRLICWTHLARTLFVTRSTSRSCSGRALVNVMKAAEHGRGPHVGGRLRFDRTRDGGVLILGLFGATQPAPRGFRPASLPPSSLGGGRHGGRSESARHRVSVREPINFSAHGPGGRAKTSRTGLPPFSARTPRVVTRRNSRLSVPWGLLVYHDWTLVPPYRLDETRQ